MEDDEPALLHEPDLMLAILRAAHQAPASLDDAMARLHANLAAAHEPLPEPEHDLRLPARTCGAASRGWAAPPFSPRPAARAPPSLWRLTRLALLSLLAALLGTCRLATWRAQQRRLERLLAEPPRCRQAQLLHSRVLLT